MKTHKWCAGLDVHKVEVVACLRLISKRKVEPGGAPFSDEHAGIIGACRVAGERGMHARGDGSDGRVLEAGLAHFGRAVCAHPSERSAREDRVLGGAAGNAGSWASQIALRNVAARITRRLLPARETESLSE
jgi:hypothetical protein